MVMGLNVLETPLEGGNALSHSRVKFTSSIIIWPGSFLKGKVLLRALARSLMMLICHSMLGTCSLADMVFSVMGETSSRKGSHSLSINAVLTLKP
jgi:hypothetical protein